MLVALLLALGIGLLALPYGEITLAGLTRFAKSVPATDPPLQLPIVVLVGLATLAAASALVSLAGGLGLGAFVAVLLLGLALATWRRSPLAALLTAQARDLRHTGAPSLLALTAGALLALERAAAPIHNYDTGAYHAQVIHWLESCGMVPGLANLHHRFAYSPGWFAPSALFSLSFLGGRSFHLLNLLLYLLLLLWAASAAAEWRASPRPTSSRSLSLLLRLLLPPAGLFLYGDWLSSPSPDVPTAFLLWILAILFFQESPLPDPPPLRGRGHPLPALNAVGDGLQDPAVQPSTVPAAGVPGDPPGRLARPEGEGFRRRPGGFPGTLAAAITLLAAFAIGVKLSALPIALLPLALAARDLFRKDRRRALLLALTGIAFATPYFLMIVVASGYLVFPLPSLDLLDPDWKVPHDIAVLALAWVHDWARVPHHPGAQVEAMTLRQWIPLWWDHQPWHAQAALISLLALTPVALVTALRRPARWLTLEAALYGTLYAGAIFWLVEAPDPRFGWGFLLPLLLLLALPPLATVLARRRRPALTAYAVALILFFLWRAEEIQGWQPDSFAAENLLLPADYEIPATRPFAIPGLTVQVPVRNDRCWYTPFPCTPFPDARLRLRGKSLAEGFRFPPEASP